ncbi:MAG: 3-carboxy-cis,cis-muconate cycloisomerase [Solirubrobacteraceae bacterium]
MASTARFTDARVPSPGTSEVFAEDRRWQRYLDVEAALALAEAEVGLIPRSAANAIAAAARTDVVDLDRVRAGVNRSSHPLMPLVVELSEAVGDPHGRWVHWGATTQNITQTGDVLGLREAYAIVVDLLAEVLSEAADLAERGAEMVMAGRTHGQHAVPITFGFKVAAWIDQLARHLERLLQSSGRVFVAMMGGAAGTFASFGELGPAVQAGVAERLGLGVMPVPARSIADPFAELVCVLAMLAATGGAIAAEIAALMQTEFGEVAEPAPPGVIGSTTMPHKRNPQLCQDMVALSARVRATVPLALEGMDHPHEVDAARTSIMDDAVTSACVDVADQLVRLRVVLGGLELHPDRMRANLDLTGGLISSEAVMLALGETIGRQEAHRVVYEAAESTRVDGLAFADALAGHDRVREHLSPETIATLLDPLAHSGLSAQLAGEAAARARSSVARASAIP